MVESQSSAVSGVFRFDPMCGVGLAVGRQPSKLIYTGSIPVPRSIPHECLH